MWPALQKVGERGEGFSQAGEGVQEVAQAWGAGRGAE